MKGNLYFSFTSSEIQKINEVKNVTSINLGDCENKIKNEYDIANESSLYIFSVFASFDFDNLLFLRFLLSKSEIL